MSVALPRARQVPLAGWLRIAVRIAAMAAVASALALFPDDPTQPKLHALTRFRANRFTGLLLALGCWGVGNA